ncbi:MAG: iron chelate uptake ABC transporter family permease subunit [Oscillospiraceae bacterium]
MFLTKDQLRLSWEADRRKERKRFWITLAAVLAIFLLCLCFRYHAYDYDDKFCPAEYAKSYALAIRLLFARIFDTPLWYRKEAAIEAVGGSVSYYGALAQLRLILMTFVSGAAVSLAGAIFQTAYRNPMASPNIIGASAGVGLGNVVVVMLYSAACFDHILLRYEYCYGFTAACVILVLLLGKIAGSRRENYSILDMIMAGSVISQIINVFTMYFMYNLEDEDLVLYELISLGTYIDTSALSMTVFLAVMAVSVLPVLLMRYRFNAIGMDKEETTSLGISTKGMRLVGQICGALMVTSAMIHCGQVGMISMVIPYMMRRVVGSDFRLLAVYSALVGGGLLMICRLVTSFFLIAGEPLPVNFLIQLVLMPAFVVIVARQRGTRYEA